ncbi:site-2 protease family protein [Planctomicrobium sp. SH661]|uniref:site-2 protease family protein n=1 Tax=Planctomicrobium sp. SH661 TaxID=3448124 RepID=UPI003F5BF347
MFSLQVFTVRNDLVIRPIRQGDQTCWVVKDPVSRKFYYFNEQEHAILSWLDGTCSTQEIVSRFCRKFAPRHLSLNQLSQFLSQLAKANLLKGRLGSDRNADHSELGHRLGGMVSNPLAIRLPGVNPTRFLDVLAPWCEWLFWRSTLWTFALLILTALASAIVRFDDIIASFPQLQAWKTSQVLLTTGAVLIVTKLVHELAHALTARHFGARCESMGVLLLIFTPCLYCDVSDAWLLTSRRARIAISAAGMIAELVLASIATLLWMVSRDEPTRAVLLTVMTVCSANTLLFNGNPLMRYDGYFILSDLLGMPNLAAESATRITSTLRSWIWGEHAFALREETFRDQCILWIYGLLSTGYRLVLMSAILVAIFRFLDDRGLGLLGGGFAAITVATLFTKTAVNLLRPPASMRSPQHSRFGRPLAVLGCLAAMLMGVLLIPIPRRLDAPFRIESRQSRDVFVSVAGDLVWAVESGQSVRSGDRIAELRNPAVELELQKIELELASQRSRLKSLDARRGLLASADERPALVESIAGLEKKLSVLARQKQELVILSSRGGVVHDPPFVQAPPLESEVVTNWTGSPLDPRNRDCYLPQGTLLCSITDDAEKQAVIYLSQRRVQRVRPGQTARLWLPGLPDEGLTAKVVEVSPAPVEEIPAEFVSSNVIPISPVSASGKREPKEPMYRVVVQLPASDVSLPLRSTGQAAIRVAPVTLWQVIREFVRESFTP